jgi:hypothetical protein
MIMANKDKPDLDWRTLKRLRGALQMILRQTMAATIMGELLRKDLSSHDIKTYYLFLEAYFTKRNPENFNSFAGKNHLAKLIRKTAVQIREKIGIKKFLGSNQDAIYDSLTTLIKKKLIVLEDIEDEYKQYPYLFDTQYIEHKRGRKSRKLQTYQPAFFRRLFEMDYGGEFEIYRFDGSKEYVSFQEVKEALKDALLGKFGYEPSKSSPNNYSQFSKAQLEEECTEILWKLDIPPAMLSAVPPVIIAEPFKKVNEDAKKHKN